MIIVMQPGHTRDQAQAVIAKVEQLGYQTHPIYGVERTVIACVGHEDKTPLQQLESMEGVESAFPILKPYKLVSREFKPEASEVKVGNFTVGGKKLMTIAGPCSVESREQVIEIAHAVKKAGAQFLRGGAYKPRTSPYAFQGLRREGLEYLAEAREQTGLQVVTEIVSVDDLDEMEPLIDVFQIGARNCQNYALLNAVGQTRKPVLLKRGMATLISEYLQAAEYIMSQGNYNVILCERGIRTFETATRFTLDLNAIPVIKRETHLPVIVDPSHGTGRRDLVTPMTRAGIAAGADGISIEVHNHPDKAMSDGAQSLTPDLFEELIAEAKKIALAMDREI